MSTPTSPSGLTRLHSLTPSVLAGLRRGVEKESLRVRPDGMLATTPHPAQLGSALTHPRVTTDFSESQLELITGVHGSAEACLDELTEIHQVVYRAIGDELLWCASMPCRLPADDAIPIGRYGTSNVGRAKSVYRMGLSHRYGRRMQTISGIHYNFSLPAPLSNDAYFALIRNFRRHSWLLLYLFGASPAVCASFVAGRAHELERLSEDTSLPAVRDFAAHGPAGLPERRAVLARGELQQPRELRGLAAGGAHHTLSGLRGDRHPRRRRLPPARHQPAADRERVLRDDPAEARDPAWRTGVARLARARRRVRRGAADGPRSVLRRRHHRRNDALSRHVPAALPAARKPARHAAGDRPPSSATPSGSPRAGASRDCVWRASRRK